MKKNRIIILFIVGITFFYNCSLFDKVAPEITILGENPISIECGTNYTDEGATAYDINDGDLSDLIIVTGSVDVDVVGTYIIQYNVTDSAGNKAKTVSRVVDVVVVPEAPSGLSAEQVGTDVVLTWVDNSDNEDYFQVWRDGSLVSVDLVAGTSGYTDEDVLVGNRTYNIVAGNSAGTSESGPVDILVVEAPETPEVTSASVNCTIYLNIDNAVLGDWYDVYRRESGGSWEMINSFEALSDGLIIVEDDTALYDILYEYYFVARNSGGIESGDSEIVTGSIDSDAVSHFTGDSANDDVISDILEDMGMEIVYTGIISPDIEGIYDTERNLDGSLYYFETEFSNQGVLNQTGTTVDISLSVGATFSNALLTGLDNNFTLWYTYDNGGVIYLYVQTGIINESTGIITSEIIRITLSGPYTINQYADIYTPQ